MQSPILSPGLEGLAGSDLLLIGGEIFLGLWLISGALPQVARRVAIGCFSIFACYTLYKALSGKTDCGCFGQVQVNPWFTFVLDTIIVFALVFLAKPAKDTERLSRMSKRKWPVAAASGIGLTVGIIVAMLHPKPAIAASGFATADGGKFVILDPQKWIGRQLPVLTHIVTTKSDKSLAVRLTHGQWVILFYHANCGECQKVIPIYERVAAQWEAKDYPLHMAFVRVPSDGGAAIPKDLFHSSLLMHGTLDGTHQWFAATPVVVELKNGSVIRAAANMAAMR